MWGRCSARVWLLISRRTYIKHSIRDVPRSGCELRPAMPHEKSPKRGTSFGPASSKKLNSCSSTARQLTGTGSGTGRFVSHQSSQASPESPRAPQFPQISGSSSSRNHVPTGRNNYGPMAHSTWTTFRFLHTPEWIWSDLHRPCGLSIRLRLALAARAMRDRPRSRGPCRSGKRARMRALWKTTLKIHSIFRARNVRGSPNSL
jgi:hypothetical protein